MGSVARIDVWKTTIGNKPGALADKLQALADAGVDIEVTVGRRLSARKAVVFLSPIKGAKAARAARAAGFEKADDIYSVRVETTNKPGLGATHTRALADAGINLRGVTSTVKGKDAIIHFATDTREDASKAVRVLKKLV